jgi:allantoate deiminase
VSADAINDELAAAVMDRCGVLGAISEEEGRLTRRSFTPAMRRANDQVAAWMRAAGMAVREDAIGSLRGRYEAGRPGAPTLLIGSHLDSVRDAGRYDGPLGVLVALAAVEALQAAGRRLPFAVEVAAFTDEEGVRFGRSFFGSMVAAGCFEAGLLDLEDADGVTLAAALRAFGGDPAGLTADALRPERLLGYLEVHISRARCWRPAACPSGSSAPSPAPPARRCGWMARRATPAPCRWGCAATRSAPPPRSCWPWRRRAAPRPASSPRWGRSARCRARAT